MSTKFYGAIPAAYRVESFANITVDMDTFNNMFESNIVGTTIVEMDSEPLRLDITYAANYGGVYEAKIITEGYTQAQGHKNSIRLFTWRGSQTTWADWGFSEAPNIGTTTVTYSVAGYNILSWKSKLAKKMYGAVFNTQSNQYVTKEVTKLYGSVNGQTKLVYVKENA